MRFLAAILLASTLAMAGCATAPVGGGTTITIPTIPSISPSVDATITKVQSVTKTACGFLPAVQTVADLIGTFTSVGPAVDVATNIASQICAAVSKAGVRRGTRALPVLRGVQLRGQFIQR